VIDKTILDAGRARDRVLGQAVLEILDNPSFLFFFSSFPGTIFFFLPI
jgi:hypothetical protein